MKELSFFSIFLNGIQHEYLKLSVKAELKQFYLFYLSRISNNGWQTVVVQNQHIIAIHQHLTAWPNSRNGTAQLVSDDI